MCIVYIFSDRDTITVQAARHAICLAFRTAPVSALHPLTASGGSVTLTGTFHLPAVFSCHIVSMFGSVRGCVRCPGSFLRASCSTCCCCAETMHWVIPSTSTNFIFSMPPVSSIWTLTSIPQSLSLLLFQFQCWLTMAFHRPLSGHVLRSYRLICACHFCDIVGNFSFLTGYFSFALWHLVFWTSTAELM
jgi:hypothetical protein